VVSVRRWEQGESLVSPRALESFAPRPGLLLPTTARRRFVIGVEFLEPKGDGLFNPQDSLT